MDDVRASKLLSLILRHDPGAIGLQLDDSVWVALSELLEALAAAGKTISRDQLLRVVRTSDKQRFAVDSGLDRIRANQGHSVQVQLGLPPAVPPSTLYHGTPERNVQAILSEGLRRGERHAVHLSGNLETAAAVGSRRGAFVIFEVDSGLMQADGLLFTVSQNGVWLVSEVPAQYLRLRGSIT